MKNKGAIGDILIRKANKEDIGAIVRLNSLLADYHHDLDPYWKTGSRVRKSYRKIFVKELRRRNIRYYVAEDKGRVVGYFCALIKAASSTVNTKHIGHIRIGFVQREYRGKGIGREAVKIFLDWFKQKKIRYVELNVDARNALGVSVWKRFGFKECMKRMRLELSGE
ncbi:MAG: GNAT family N-acetyltransferase [Patescibacteria group bacterium]